jgi:hypothetical protein
MLPYLYTTLTATVPPVVLIIDTQPLQLNARHLNDSCDFYGAADSARETPCRTRSIVIKDEKTHPTTSFRLPKADEFLNLFRNPAALQTLRQLRELSR